MSTSIISPQDTSIILPQDNPRIPSQENLLRVPDEQFSRFRCSPQDRSQLLCSPPPDYQDTIHGQSPRTPSSITPLHTLQTSILSPRSCYDSNPPSYQDIYPSNQDIKPQKNNKSRTILINVTELHDSRNPNWLSSLPQPPPGVDVPPPRNRSYRERMRYLQDLRR